MVSFGNLTTTALVQDGYPARSRVLSLFTLGQQPGYQPADSPIDSAPTGTHVQVECRLRIGTRYPGSDRVRASQEVEPLSRPTLVDDYGNRIPRPAVLPREPGRDRNQLAARLTGAIRQRCRPHDRTGLIDRHTERHRHFLAKASDTASDHLTSTSPSWSTITASLADDQADVVAEAPVQHHRDAPQSAGYRVDRRTAHVGGSRGRAQQLDGLPVRRVQP